ncbi:hypothetical protein SAMN05428976_10752 [Clostridium sp. USBA 49]|uniref:hypothetical protein n=1 Tax=Clostridium sp. USBA 49 TaxID=1881060 RepID=UPI00099B22F0|nr:hypothetical protein [Clostridium sp. USBA 49]SKA85164.1 hypothetical protein SAMN05428976_10752 [Clostridium sp. USBA 49]
MKKEAKSLIIYNILFYIFIFIHRYYASDYVPQVLLYMFLAFSSIFLEESIKRKINKQKAYALFDFSIRMVTLIIHFVALVLNSNLIRINLATAGLFIINIIIEIDILMMVRNEKEDECETIKQVDLNKFIEDFKCKRLDFFVMGTELKDEVESLLETIELSGKNTIVMITLFILLFVSRFAKEHFFYFFLVTMLLIAFLFNLLFKLSHQIVCRIYNNNKFIRKRFIIDISTFTMGYTILLIHQVIFNGKMGTFGVSIDVVPIMLFIPIYKTKLIAKKKLESIYRKYKVRV